MSVRLATSKEPLSVTNVRLTNTSTSNRTLANHAGLAARNVNHMLRLVQSVKLTPNCKNQPASVTLVTGQIRLVARAARKTVSSARTILIARSVKPAFTLITTLAKTVEKASMLSKMNARIVEQIA